MPKRNDDEIQGIGIVFSLKSALGRGEFDEVMPKPKEIDYSKILDYDMIHYVPEPRKFSKFDGDN